MILFFLNRMGSTYQTGENTVNVTMIKYITGKLALSRAQKVGSDNFWNLVLLIYNAYEFMFLSRLFNLGIPKALFKKKEQASYG